MKYIITASVVDHLGTRVDSTNYETLGDVLHREFDTREAAEREAEVLHQSASAYGLDPSTIYEVSER